jgi:hypothetical protein
MIVDYANRVQNSCFFWRFDSYSHTAAYVAPIGPLYVKFLHNCYDCCQFTLGRWPESCGAFFFFPSGPIATRRSHSDLTMNAQNLPPALLPSVPFVRSDPVPMFADRVIFSLFAIFFFKARFTLSFIGELHSIDLTNLSHYFRVASLSGCRY